MTSPRLLVTRSPRTPDAAVVVLHGGAAREGRHVVSQTQLSVLRMVPIAGRLARSGRGGLAVFRLLNSARGWDADTTPVDDARWALRQVAERYGELPVGLVGHSLGGRAALLAGSADGVRSIVALNPWVYPSDDTDLTGRRVLVVHGTADRIAPPERSLAVSRATARTAESSGYLRVEGAKHAMLRRGGVFASAAVDFVGATLLGRPAPPPVDRLLDGYETVTV